jgi:protein-tyrosine phosphatase
LADSGGTGEAIKVIEKNRIKKNNANNCQKKCNLSVVLFPVDMSLFKKKQPTGPVSGVFAFLGTDIHNHLLPGIDDGSPEAVQSIQYIRQLMNLGFSQFICTPHILPGVHNNTPETIQQAHQKLSTTLSQHEINVPLSAAAEYMLDTEMFPAIKERSLLTLKDNYVLIEMSYMDEPPNLDELLFELLIMDYKPILAHPERYICYHDRPDKLEQLRDRGCLLQANLLSFSGYYGKDVKHTAHWLLKNKLLDLAGTDFHHDRHLAALQSMSTDQKLITQLETYGFRNRELFGVNA